jgi:hypothetical protein
VAPLRRPRKAHRQIPATVADVRSLASTLPRSYEVVVRGRLKLRVGQLVYVAFSLDESITGFAFPKDLRSALVESVRSEEGRRGLQRLIRVDS